MARDVTHGVIWVATESFVVPSKRPTQPVGRFFYRSKTPYWLALVLSAGLHAILVNGLLTAKGTSQTVERTRFNPGSAGEGRMAARWVTVALRPSALNRNAGVLATNEQLPPPEPPPVKVQALGTAQFQSGAVPGLSFPDSGAEGFTQVRVAAWVTVNPEGQAQSVNLARTAGSPDLFASVVEWRLKELAYEASRAPTALCVHVVFDLSEGVVRVRPQADPSLTQSAQRCRQWVEEVSQP